MDADSLKYCGNTERVALGRGDFLEEWVPSLPPETLVIETG